MAFSRHFFPPYNFAYTQCFGVVDDASLRIHLISFAIESQGMTTIRELVDTRAIVRADKATVKGLIELTGMDKNRLTERQEFLAILVSDPLIYEMARLYACSVKTVKQAVAIFHTVNDALVWLGYAKKEVGTLRKFINKNRISAC